MDIMPTIIDKCGINVIESVAGKNLFKEDKYDYLMIEDHKTFDVSLGQTIERRGILNEKD